MSPFLISGFATIAADMAGFFKRARDSTKVSTGKLGAAGKPWMARTQEFGGWRRVRKTGMMVLRGGAILGLATNVAVPPILRHVLTGSVATSIHRQVSVGKIRFNLYRLKLDLDDLLVAERDAPKNRSSISIISP